MGNYYDISWVAKLKRNVARHLNEPHKFVCLTNTLIPDVDCIPLKHPSWTGWWSKIELFEPGLFDGPVLYLDLDVFATRSLEDFIQPRENLVMLRDYIKYVNNSTIMYWNGSDERLHSIYTDFVADEEEIKARHWHTCSLGDQGYITDVLERKNYHIDLWQDLLGTEGFIPFSWSMKLNPKLHSGILPEDTRLVYCLGRPKFHQFRQLKFVQEHWL
jgi:hypothetical protein